MDALLESGLELIALAKSTADLSQRMNEVARSLETLDYELYLAGSTLCHETNGQIAADVNAGTVAGVRENLRKTVDECTRIVDSISAATLDLRIIKLSLRSVRIVLDEVQS